jgi:hypothetical protein
MKRLENSAATEIEVLRQAVAVSPIQVASRPVTPAVVPDWENARHSRDVDALILAWIASHVRGAGHRRVH